MHIIQLIILSFAVSSISYTISKSNIFKPLRLFISKYWKWAGELISCPYCLSHWLSFATMIYIYKTINFDVFILSFAVVGGSAVITGMISRSFDFMVSDD